MDPKNQKRKFAKGHYHEEAETSTKKKLKAAKHKESPSSSDFMSTISTRRRKLMLHKRKLSDNRYMKALKEEYQNKKPYNYMKHENQSDTEELAAEMVHHQIEDQNQKRVKIAVRPCKDVKLTNTPKGMQNSTSSITKKRSSKQKRPILNLRHMLFSKNYNNNWKHKLQIASKKNQANEPASPLTSTDKARIVTHPHWPTQLEVQETSEHCSILQSPSANHSKLQTGQERISTDLHCPTQIEVQQTSEHCSVLQSPTANYSKLQSRQEKQPAQPKQMITYFRRRYKKNNDNSKPESPIKQPSEQAKMEHRQNTKRIRKKGSPSKLMDITSSLNTDQIALIEAISFHGLLEIKCSYVHERLTSWLISLYDMETSTLRIPGRGDIPVNEAEAQHMFHLPRGPREIDYYMECDASTRTLFNQIFCCEKGRAPKFTEVETMLKTGKSLATDGYFIRRWVTFAVSSFLCATTSTRVSYRAFHAIADVSKIKEYNWCKLVVDQIRRGIKEFRSGKKESVSGCLFFLMLLYLDSLDVEVPDSLGNKCRASVWDEQLVQKVIKQDKTSRTSFGKLHLKQTFSQQKSSILFAGPQAVDQFLHMYIPPDHPKVEKLLLASAITKSFIGLEELIAQVLKDFVAHDEEDISDTIATNEGNDMSTYSVGDTVDCPVTTHKDIEAVDQIMEHKELNDEVISHHVTEYETKEFDPPVQQSPTKVNMMPTHGNSGRKEVPTQDAVTLKEIMCCVQTKEVEPPVHQIPTNANMLPTLGNSGKEEVATQYESQTFLCKPTDNPSANKVNDTDDAIAKSVVDNSNTSCSSAKTSKNEVATQDESQYGKENVNPNMQTTPQVRDETHLHPTSPLHPRTLTFSSSGKVAPLQVLTTTASKELVAEIKVAEERKPQTHVGNKCFTSLCFDPPSFDLCIDLSPPTSQPAHAPEHQVSKPDSPTWSITPSLFDRIVDQSVQKYNKLKAAGKAPGIIDLDEVLSPPQPAQQQSSNDRALIDLTSPQTPAQPAQQQTSNDRALIDLTSPQPPDQPAEQQSSNDRAHINFTSPQPPAPKIDSNIRSWDMNYNSGPSQHKLPAQPQLFAPYPVGQRIIRSTRYQKSPYIDYDKQKPYRSTQAADEFYTKLNSFSSKDHPSREADAFLGLDLQVTIGTLVDSLKPLGKVLPPVAELGIQLLSRALSGTRKKIVSSYVGLNLVTKDAQFNDAVRQNLGFHPQDRLDKNYDFIMVPVPQILPGPNASLANAHWFLVVLNLKAKRFEIFDPSRVEGDQSLSMAAVRVVSKMKSFWFQSFRSAASCEMPAIFSYPMIYIDAPKQIFQFDNVLYVLKYIELWKGQKIRNFGHKDMPSIRRMFAYSCIHSVYNTAGWRSYFS